MIHTQAYQLWLLISDLKEAYKNESDWVKRQKIYKRLKKYNKMYDTCVNDEQHKEIIHIETLTKGF